MKITVTNIHGRIATKRTRVSFQLIYHKRTKLPISCTTFLSSIEIVSLQAPYNFVISDVILDISSPDLFISKN